MVAATFTNASFERAGAADDATAPDPWTSSEVNGATEVAGWSDGPTELPWEDFELDWFDAAAPPHLIVSAQEPFALIDGTAITFVTTAGATTILFEAADFADIAAASAAEVRDVINAQAGGVLVADDALGRVAVQPVPFGGPIQVAGQAHQSTANEVLAFPRVVHAFVADDIDASRATFAGGLSREGFEAGYAGIAARIFTSNKAPFNISNGGTLDVEVDGGAPQTVVWASVTVAGAATADEVAADLNAQLIGATATAIGDIEVRIESDFVGPGSGIAATGGTTLAALAFTPSAGFVVPGNANFHTVLPGSTAALFSTALVAVEGFESEWDANEDFLWVLTVDRIYVPTVAEDDVFELTLGDETFTHTATAVDSATSVATNLAARVNHVTSGSALMSAAGVGETIELTRIDNRFRVASITLTVNGEVLPAATGTATTGADLEAAAFDTAPTDFEDFEEDWLNNDWLWQHTPIAYVITSVVVGAVYELDYGPAGDRRSVSYTAVLGDDATSIAAELAALLVPDPDVTTTPTANGITVTGVGTFQINPQATETALWEWQSEATSAGLEAATFGTAVDPFEDFDTTLNGQLRMVWAAADPQPAGTYSFKLNGQLMRVIVGAPTNAADLCDSFITAIAASVLKNTFEAITSVGTLVIRSQSCPRVEGGVSEISFPTGGDFEAQAIDPTQFWTNLAHMCSI